MQTWQKPGDLTDYQRISSARQFSRGYQGRFVVRFRNLQVGYFSSQECEEMLQEHAHLGTGQNLFTLDQMDRI